MPWIESAFGLVATSNNIVTYWEQDIIILIILHTTAIHFCFPVFPTTRTAAAVLTLESSFSFSFHHLDSCKINQYLPKLQGPPVTDTDDTSIGISTTPVPDPGQGLPRLQRWTDLQSSFCATAGPISIQPSHSKSVSTQHCLLSRLPSTPSRPSPPAQTLSAAQFKNPGLPAQD